MDRYGELVAFTRAVTEGGFSGFPWIPAHNRPVSGALLLDHDVPLADDVPPVAELAFEEAAKLAGIREARLQVVIQEHLRDGLLAGERADP